MFGRSKLYYRSGCSLLQGGKEVLGKIMGYKLQPLADAVKQLDAL